MQFEFARLSREILKEYLKSTDSMSFPVLEKVWEINLGFFKAAANPFKLKLLSEIFVIPESNFILISFKCAIAAKS